MKIKALKPTVFSLCILLLAPHAHADSLTPEASGVHVRAVNAPSPGNLSNQEKEDYQQRISSTKIGAGLFYVVGGAGVIGGLALVANGIHQRNNAEFKQKGDIITNEDDINDGNTKVAQGSLIELGGALFITGGILMSLHARHIREDAENKGYSLSFVPTSHGTGGMLAYAKRF